jgi:hypothetical protein
LASSKVDICNAALIRLGADTISALSDNNERARLCNQTYDRKRRMRLRSHPWRFSIARQALSESSTEPAFGFEHQFPLPSDCLRPISLDNEAQVFQIEGRMLLTDDDEADLKYIKDVTAEQDFDDLFSEVLALDIAEDLARHLTNSETVVESIRKERAELLRDARSFDAQEGTPEDMNDDVWLNARL